MSHDKLVGRLGELYWAHQVRAVDSWLETGFPIAETILQGAGIAPDRDLAASEALTAALALGNVALEGLDDPQLATRLEISAVDFAVSKGERREDFSRLKDLFARVADDSQRAYIVGTWLLARMGHPDVKTLAPSMKAAVGTFLFADAILAWRHVQDRAR